jgi:hypothetical protein
MVAALDEQTVKKICYKEMERWCAWLFCLI